MKYETRKYLTEVIATWFDKGFRAAVFARVDLNDLAYMIDADLYEVYRDDEHLWDDQIITEFEDRLREIYNSDYSGLYDPDESDDWTVPDFEPHSELTAEPDFWRI